MKRYSDYVACSQCKGTGRIVDWSISLAVIREVKCPSCNGTGKGDKP